MGKGGAGGGGAGEEHKGLGQEVLSWKNNHTRRGEQDKFN